MSDSYPEFTPDGSKIVFTRGTRLREYSFGGDIGNDVDICEINQDGTNFRQLTTEKYYQLFPPLLTQKGVVYFTAEPSSLSISFYLYSLNANQNSTTTQVGPKRTTTSSELSPDGKSLLCISAIDGQFQYEIVEFSLNDMSQKVYSVRKYTTYPTIPKYSPNGKIIYFLGDPVSFDKPDLMKLDRSTGKIEKVFVYEHFLNPLSKP